MMNQKSRILILCTKVLSHEPQDVFEDLTMIQTESPWHVFGTF